MRSSVRCLRPLAACSALAAAMLVSTLATASGVAPGEASAAQKSEAMSHFTSGKRALEEKNWEKATLELRASLDVVNSPNARLELARAIRDSGNAGEAWVEYGRVVDDATKLAAAEPRYTKTAEAATGERAALEAKIALITVTVAHAPADATLKAAGRPVPSQEWAAPIVVPAGAVDVVLSDAGGKELARQTVSATTGQKTAVALDAQPAPPVPMKPAATDPDDKPDMGHAPEQAVAPVSDRSKLRPYAYVAGGVGVAGLALFTVFGLMDNSTYSDLQGACQHNVCPPGKQSEVDSGRTQQAVANVGLVVGAVGVAAGATLFVLSLSPKSSPAASTGLIVAPGYFGLKGTL